MASGVGRFQVMATLQAARAKELGLPQATAKSWGLNRAIYYAAAKRGFKKPPGAVPGKPKGVRSAVREFQMGDDKAFTVTVNGKTLFTIGGEVQKPADFDRQIAQRFADAFDRAWDEAMRIIQTFPREVLESQAAFYEQVYRPRRDELVKKWTELAAKQGR